MFISMERLQHSIDFAQVRERGVRKQGSLCAMNAFLRSPSADVVALSDSRFGFITSKRVGNAVKRNRARRLMREAVRQSDLAQTQGWDIVLVAHSRITSPEIKMQHVRDELAKMARAIGILS